MKKENKLLVQAFQAFDCVQKYYLVGFQDSYLPFLACPLMLIGRDDRGLRQNPAATAVRETT